MSTCYLHTWRSFSYFKLLLVVVYMFLSCLINCSNVDNFEVDILKVLHVLF